MRNFVSKNDFNKGGYHKDLKNDYDRQLFKKEVDKELDVFDSSLVEDQCEKEKEVK